MPANSSEYNKRWYRENHDREKKKRREYITRYRVTHPEHEMLKRAKNRAKSGGLAFDLSLEDIVIPECCPILGVKLARGTRYAPSLDRRDPELGYIKENIWVISRKANVMKNDASAEELEAFRSWLNSLKT